MKQIEKEQVSSQLDPYIKVKPESIQLIRAFLFKFLIQFECCQFTNQWLILLVEKR